MNQVYMLINQFQFNDNRVEVFMATNSGSTERAKHVDIKYHFVKDIIEQRNIILERCSSRDMDADIFTKPLDTQSLRNVELCWA